MSSSTINFVPATASGMTAFVNGCVVAQRPGIDPMYDGPPNDDNHGGDGPRGHLTDDQNTAITRVINGSTDPDHVLRLCRNARGFHRVEPELEGTVKETYALAMPPDAMYGELRKLTYAMEAPLGWAYCSLLTMYAGFGINLNETHPKVMPTLYTALVADKGTGKSAVQKRAKLMIGVDDDDVLGQPVSDRGLIRDLRNGLDKDEPPGPTMGPLLLDDEMLGLLQKMSITNSTLGQAFCQLWSSDTISVTDKSGKEQARRRLSYLGNLKVKDASHYAAVMSAKTSDGFEDRFVKVPGPDDWNPDWCWDPPISVSDDSQRNGNPADLPAPHIYPRPTCHTTVPNEIFAMLEAWKASHRANGVQPGRRGELALRVAVISANASKEKTVSRECMIAALKFADWQIRVGQVYASTEGLNDDAVLTALIENYFRELVRRHDEGKPVKVGGKPVYDGTWVNRRLAVQATSWGKRYGSAMVDRVMRSMCELGILQQQTKLVDDKTGRTTKENKFRLVTAD